MKISGILKMLIGVHLIPISFSDKLMNYEEISSNPPSHENILKDEKQYEFIQDLHHTAPTDSEGTTKLYTSKNPLLEKVDFLGTLHDDSSQIKDDSSDTASTSSLYTDISEISHLTEAPDIRILSLDGGGVRGIILVRILMRIEQEVGKPISQIFDLIGGTSAGGMIATLLSIPDPENPTSPKYSAEDILHLLLTRSSSLFTQNFLSFGGALGTKYTRKGLKFLLKEFYSDIKLQDSLVNTAVFAYDIENEVIETLSSWSSSEILVRDAVGATTAAPVYFPAYTIKPLQPTQNPSITQHPYKSYIDGGVGVNDPSIMLWIEASQRFEGKNTFDILSLGTGDFKKKIKTQKVKDGGLLTWLKYFPRLVSSNQQGNTRTILNFFMKTQKSNSVTTNAPESRQKGFYTRLNPPMIGESSALDNYAPEHLNNLIRLTDIYLLEHETEINQMIERLKGERYTDWKKVNAS